jgi:hypothetical protein
VAQRKPEEQSTIDQVLKLVENLTPEAQEQLVEDMKLQWLRKAMDEAEESIKQHGTIPAQEVFARLEERYKRRKARTEVTRAYLLLRAASTLAFLWNIISGQQSPGSARNHIRQYKCATIECFHGARFATARAKRPPWDHKLCR